MRDILDVSDAVDAYVSAWRRIAQVSGRAFNLGGGPENAVSLRQLIAHIESLLGRLVPLEFADWRPGDQRYYVSDTRLAQQELGLGSPRPWREGVAALATWLQGERAGPARRLAVGAA